MNMMRMLCVLAGLAIALNVAAAWAQQPPLLISGTIVASDKVYQKGWIAIQDGKIKSISAAKPKLDGALAPGREADLFLLHPSKPGRNVYETLANAAPGDVTLSVVAGLPIYGAPDHLAALGQAQGDPVAICGQGRAVGRDAFPIGLNPSAARRTEALAQENLQLAPLAECP